MNLGYLLKNGGSRDEAYAPEGEIVDDRGRERFFLGGPLPLSQGTQRVKKRGGPRAAGFVHVPVGDCHGRYERG